FGLERVAGGPVVAGAAALVAVASVLVCSEREPAAALVARALAALGGLALGVALAAIQIVPLAGAAGRSARAAGVGAQSAAVWSIHPLALPDAVSPGIFGDPFDWSEVRTIWLLPLNGGRDPY